MKSRLFRLASAALGLTFAISSVTSTAFAAGASGTVKVGFGVFSPTMTITVPAAVGLNINAAYDTDATDLMKYSVASEPVVIENRTTSVVNGTETAIPLLMKVDAKITSTATDVNTYYNASDFTVNDTSAVKNISLALRDVTAAYDATTDATGQDWKITALGADAKIVPVTKEGSSRTFVVAKPTLASGVIATNASGYGAFAITGDANVSADWQEDDIALELTYRISPAPASITAASDPVALTLDSTDNGSTGKSAKFTITSTVLNGATVDKIVLHNDTMDFKDYVMVEDEDYTVTDATASGVTTYTYVVDNSKGALKYVIDNYAGTSAELVVVLSDGRVGVLSIANAKASA